MSILRELVRIAVVFVLIVGAGWLLATAPDDADLKFGSWRNDQVPVCIIHLDWSIDDETLMSYSRGELDPNRELQLHTPGTQRESKPITHEDDIVWSGRMFPGGGDVLATGPSEGIWRFERDAGKKRPLREIGTGEFVGKTAISPDGRIVAIISGRRLVLLDAVTGSELRSWDAGESDTIDLAFSADGRRLAGADSSGPLRVWDVDSGVLLHKLAGHAKASTGQLCSEPRLSTLLSHVAWPAQ